MSLRGVPLACVVAVAVVLLPAAPGRGQGLLSRLTGRREAARLGSSDPDERIEAARALGRWGEPQRAVEALAKALATERDVNVRRAIIAALARRGDPAAVPALLEAKETAPNLDPATAVLALGAFEDDRAVRGLVAALGQQDVEESAVRALGRVGPRAVPRLLRSMDEPSLTLPVIRVLGLVGDRRATPALVAALSSDREAVRAAAARALGRLGDRRAAPALVAALEDDAAAVVLAALEALAGAGEPGQAAAVSERVAEGDAAQRRAALAALLAIDPPSAIPVMEAAVAAGDPVLGRTSVELALACRHPRIVPLLFGLWREGSRAPQAADALAEVDGGLGVAVLVEVTEEGGGDAATRALAVALRKWERDLDDDLRERGLSALAAGGGAPERTLLLRAVARDPAVGPELARALAAHDALTRAVAARGLELLGDPAYGAAAAHAIADERDPEAWRRLAVAAVALGARVPYAVVRPHLGSVETGPEAMALAAWSSRTYSPRQRDAVARALRRALRAEDPRVRAGAARALAVGGERDAWRALVFALDDAAPEVRLAAATALADLSVPEAAGDVMARWRIEEDARVAPALLDAASPAPRRRVPPERGGPGGDEAVRVRIVSAGEEGGGGVPVDVVLSDGRWLRMRTLPSGELVLVDLPASVADVRVRVSE